MSVFFDALRKAKSDQVDKLFSPAVKVSPPRAARDYTKPAQKSVEELPNLGVADAQELVDSIMRKSPVAQVSASLPSQLRIPEVIKHPQVTLHTDTKLVALNVTSPASEQFAILRGQLLAISRTEDIRTICVTSSVTNEGKTFVATNLALALAAESERGVVIIDGDLRKPSVQKALGLKDTTGLADFLLSERTNIDSLIIDTDKHLSFIPAGRIPNNPLPLLDSEKMRELILTLRNRYDFVIIDSPPVVPFADADILATLTDGLLFVIKARQTPLTVIQRSLKMLGKHKILGTVLNSTLEVKDYGYYRSEGTNTDINTQKRSKL